MEACLAFICEVFRLGSSDSLDPSSGGSCPPRRTDYHDQCIHQVNPLAEWLASELKVASRHVPPLIACSSVRICQACHTGFYFIPSTVLLFRHPYIMGWLVSVGTCVHLSLRFDLLVHVSQPLRVTPLTSKITSLERAVILSACHTYRGSRHIFWLEE